MKNPSYPQRPDRFTFAEVAPAGIYFPSGSPEKAKLFLDAAHSGEEVAFKEEGSLQQFRGKVSNVKVVGEALTFNLNDVPHTSHSYRDFYEVRFGEQTLESHDVRVIKVQHPGPSYGRGSSFLFYHGELPDEATTAIAHRFDLTISYLRNDRTGVVAIYSPRGTPHADLQKCIAPGAKILGGTRYQERLGRIKRRNSIYFEYLGGDKIQDRNFIVQFNEDSKR